MNPHREDDAVRWHHAVADLIEALKAQGLGTYQAEYEAELQSGNDPTPTEEAT